MKRFEGNRKIVRIGNRADDYRVKLIEILYRILPKNVSIETVEEDGTTRGIDVVKIRKFRDVSSVIKISMRRGRL